MNAAQSREPAEEELSHPLGAEDDHATTSRRRIELLEEAIEIALYLPAAGRQGHPDEVRVGAPARVRREPKRFARAVLARLSEDEQAGFEPT